MKTENLNSDQADVMGCKKGAAVDCPFCNEKDFDKIGLKIHLENYCEEYKNTSEQ